MSTSKRKASKLKKSLAEKKEARTAFIQKADEGFQRFLNDLKPEDINENAEADLDFLFSKAFPKADPPKKGSGKTKH